ncbi:hypothetical protein DPMN_104697 [Dreissena polymorpha]|uniref:Uncharacterized protein n=1 Tax=Dreissena polymorpha TaxID=45954 RepID=A0A9D4HAG4_DREPO|nr:hypothetical protein DPMN_104697 [Dreissena polymorpha]
MATCLLLSLIAMFSTTIALLSDSEDFTILAYVVFAPCLVFTIENGYGSTGLTAGGAPDETSRILPPSNSVDVGNLEAGSDFYVGNNRDSLV